MEHNRANHHEHKTRCCIDRQFWADSGEAREYETQTTEDFGDSDNDVHGVVQFVHPLHQIGQSLRDYEVHNPDCHEVDAKHPLKNPQQRIAPTHSVPPLVESEDASYLAVPAQLASMRRK